MTERYFTSDLHFGHARIIELAYRPFETVDEMNEALITNWNETVRPDDHIVVVGDLVMGHRHETLPLVGQLHGHISLVPGNHDHCHPMHGARAETWTPEYAQFVDIEPTEFSVDIHGHEVLVCHFPYEGDHTDEDRYTEERPSNTGLPLIHGHIHGEWLARGNMLNVGVDVHDYRPIHEDEVALLLGLHG